MSLQRIASLRSVTSMVSKPAGCAGLLNLNYKNAPSNLANRHFSILSRSLDPEEIVTALDKHIIGQYTAKRSVAIAFRNRFRRRMVREDLQKEIMPANILMKGPTGCGKTEIARRIANLTQSPFIKVEATRYTEVGIVGANTNSMVKDLLDVAINLQRNISRSRVSETVENETERAIIGRLEQENPSMSFYFDKLRQGGYNDRTIDVPDEVAKAIDNTANSSANSGHPMLSFGGDDDGNPMADLARSLGDLMKNGSFDKKRNNKQMRITVKEALQQYRIYYTNKYVDEKEVIRQAKENTEQNGIIFIDEIDKLAVSSDTVGGATRFQHKEGVQKELLTLLEGATVNTKYGPIQTHHILFIAAGAFHTSSVSDLMPELQGRLPVRVELKSLSEKDLRRVLTEKQYNLINEAKALLDTEGVELVFTEEGLDEIARYANSLNMSRGNIGARRLTSVMHTVLEDISFLAHRMKGTSQTIDKDYVHSRMKRADPAAEENLSKYII